MSSETSQLLNNFSGDALTGSDPVSCHVVSVQSSATDKSFHSLARKVTKASLAAFGIIMAVTALPHAAVAEGNYMGAGSCSSSNCHGSAVPRKGSNVMLNEFVVWQKRDHHSKAYQVLTEPDGQRIGQNLGLAHPENEKICLDCHATNAPKSKRDERFSIEDGVACESCHGPAEGWLSSHANADTSHEENLKNGLWDIVDLEKRAKLCISCHRGTETKQVNHRLIGAGHPRLSFELDTFSMLQPRHWVVDDDYRERKADYNSIQSWLIGQTTLALDTIDALESPARSRNGAWPELTLFNCYACHHSLTEDQWKKRNYANKPGELQLNLSSIKTVRNALEVLAPDAASTLAGQIEALHGKYQNNEASALLGEMRQLLRSKAMLLAKKGGFSANTRRALLRSVAKVASGGGVYQYEEAEQLAMGMSAILAGDDALNSAHKGSVDAVYDALDKPEAYQPEKFKKAASQLVGKL